ncbi:hypothetical protein [Actinospica sp.]|uniref:hypothetical protein n=1 Tax=Actinospica sp. TaxID=1872142 RepID=UPI002C77457C|nr:hypothetical protein [Actinospica sp.]HWG23615.1 hypothetical protein [Actinospica sp.]
MARIRTAALITAALAVASGLVGSEPAFAAAPDVISPACSSQIWNPANDSNVPGNASWSVEILKANSA